jgi:hypothetical protein
MQLACPQCGSRDARVAHRKGVIELLQALVGIYPLRCRRCRMRWTTSTWESAAWKYARCPKCYRQELSTWSEHHYSPPRWTAIQLRFGATPYRCAACRCNFASYKKCKEKFAWRHQERPHTPPEVESDSPVKH